MKLCRVMAAICWFAFPILGQSQISTGVIQGVVRDSTGGVLPDATDVKHLDWNLSHLSHIGRRSLYGHFAAGWHLRAFGRTEKLFSN